VGKRFNSNDRETWVNAMEYILFHGVYWTIWAWNGRDRFEDEGPLRRVYLQKKLDRMVKRGE